MVNGAYHFLDLVPKGRDEDGLSFTMAWVKAPRSVLTAAKRGDEANDQGAVPLGDPSRPAGVLSCVAIGAMFSLPVFLQPMVRDTGWSGRRRIQAR